MANPELFVAGILVTLLVVLALALVLIGAVLDGRNDQAHDTGVPVYPTSEGESALPSEGPGADAGDARVVREA